MGTAQNDLGLRSGCEVTDWTVAPDGAVDYRQQNEAANDELRRRGDAGAVVPSGELVGWAIGWRLTCVPGDAFAWTEPGTLTRP